MSNETEKDWIEEVGGPAYRSVESLVAALECDYDRLDALKNEKKSLLDAVSVATNEYAEAIANVKYQHGEKPDGSVTEDTQYPEVREMLDCRQAWHDAMNDEKEWRSRYSDELAELIEAAGECESQDEARERILEDALSVEVRSGWYAPSRDKPAPEEFNILLCTVGPAARIRGELDEHGEPTRAWLEVQDWCKPWTQYFGADQDTLLAYARCFYYGEGVDTMNVFVLTAEHPTIPGIIMKVYANRRDAEIEAVKLIEMMYEPADIEVPAVTLNNWELVMKKLQDYYGEQYTYCQIDELPVIRNFGEG